MLYRHRSQTAIPIYKAPVECQKQSLPSSIHPAAVDQPPTEPSELAAWQRACVVRGDDRCKSEVSRIPLKSSFAAS